MIICFIDLSLISFHRSLIYFSFVQASGSMSPKMQLLRERAAIHGSISHVSTVESLHVSLDSNANWMVNCSSFFFTDFLMLLV